MQLISSHLVSHQESWQQLSWLLETPLPTTSFSILWSTSPAFSEPLILFTPAFQPPPSSPMSSLDEQLAQAVAAIMMLSNSMAAMQNQIGILTQNVAEQQQRMLQPVVPAHLSPLNIPLPPSPPSPPHHPSPHLQGQYVFPPPPSGPRNQRLWLPFTSPASKMRPNHS